MRTSLAALAAVAALAFGSPLRAATVPVTVTVDSVLNVSAGDAGWQPPDFYARIWIDGVVFRTPTVVNAHGFSSPAGWSFTRNVSRAKRGGFAPVRIELRDWDGPFPDPLVDIDPGFCRGLDGYGYGCAELTVGTPWPQPADSFGIDLNLNLHDGSLAPHTPGSDASLGPASPANPQRVCTIGYGENVANLCFTITVGPPLPETLTVSRTSDSNRGSCAPGDCSLREAVTLAEDGDTIALPAAATPYLLTLPASAFPVPNPAEPWRESGAHLRIGQPLLTIRGPASGGTAVIRQTQPGSRVFDVHAGAKLVMSRITVTGGGAGDNSTAFPGHIHGAGLHNHGTIELTHVTITGNHATFSRSASVGGGGGIYNAGTATAKLDNVTIAGNGSESNVNGIPLGGGIAGPGAFTLRNTVIAGNTVGAASSNCGLGTPMNIVDEGGNLQFPGGDCGRWVTFTTPRGTTFTFWRTFITTAASDPLAPPDPLRPIFPPAPAGPAVDLGVAGCGPTDQEGQPAPHDGNADGVAACDVGAIEAR